MTLSWEQARLSWDTQPLVMACRVLPGMFTKTHKHKQSSEILLLGFSLAFLIDIFPVNQCSQVVFLEDVLIFLWE